MARTKAAARKGRKLTQMGDINSPPDTGDTMEVDGDSKMEEDSEDEGGVNLNNDDSSMIRSIPYDITSISEPTQYFQSTISVNDQSTCQWQLPVTPLGIGPGQLKKLGLTHPMPARIYHQACRLTSNFWRCEPTNLVPEGLRQQTPYSLAMLAMMRSLCHTIHHEFEVAQSLLLDAWKGRVAGYENSDAQAAIYLGETEPGIKGCERTIQENYYGLILGDVENALKISKERMKQQKSERKRINKAANKARHAENQARKTVKAERKAANKGTKHDGLRVVPNLEHIDSSGIAARVVERRRTEKASRESKPAPRRLRQPKPSRRFDFTAPDDHPGGVTLVAPSAPIPGSEGKYSTFEVAGLSIRARPAETTDVPYTLSAHDKENEYSISSMMDTMGMDITKRPYKERQQSLPAKEKRRRNVTETLPAERFNLSNMSTLPNFGSGTSAEALARLGQQSLPD